MTRNKNALKTKGLTIGYRSRHQETPVLSNLNLKLAKTSLVCFMGPNGVGKSTLIRTLCGLQPPLGGTISIGKDTLASLSTQERAQKIAVVLTDRISAGNMTGRELIMTGRYPYLGWTINHSEYDEHIIEQAILQTRLHKVVDKYLHEMSDGQLQKVMIARALCQDTPLIILDEPTAHLDLNNRVEIINLLKLLAHETGKTILMATHELDLALQAADRIWLAGLDGSFVDGFPEDLVLSGEIDKVFGLKGYNLKTGVLHKTTTTRHGVQLSGEGHDYLWTKNALERCGFQIDAKAETKITLIKQHEEVSWLVEKEGICTTNSLENLISFLNKELKD